MTAWANVATSRPGAVLLVSALLAIAGILLAATQLEFQSNRDDLVDRDLPWQQRYTDFKRQFPRWNDVVIVVERSNPEHDDLRDEFVTELTSRLESTGEFATVTGGFPTSEAPAGLLLSESIARVQRVATDLRRSAPILGAPTAGQLLSLPLLSPNLDDVARSELADLMRRLVAAGKGAPPADGVLGASPPVQRLTSSDGALAFVLVSLNQGNAPPDAQTLEIKIQSLRGIVRRLLDDPRYEAINAGVTGVPVLEADEARQSIDDASRSTILAFILIAALLVFVYRGIWAPALAIIALLIGVAWSFGYLTLAVGHLQLLSIVFAVILLGLGVDTAIHLIARLELVHPDHDHLPLAIARTFRGVGPGVVTSALTTAAAFAVTALTEFKGVAEMGIIAAGGVILCAISVMTCFPAMLEFLPRPEKKLRSREGGESKPFAGGAINFVDTHARLFVGLALALTLGAAVIGAGVTYDPDIFKLMPSKSESVAWAQKLEADEDRSVWHAVVVADNAIEASRLARRLRRSPLVSEVGDAGMLFPEQLEEKQAILSQLPDPAAFSVDAVAIDARDIARQLETRWRGVDDALAKAAGDIAALNDDELNTMEQAYASDRAALAARFAQLRTAQPPSVEELPDALRSLWTSENGSLLLRIYPESDGVSSPLSPENLEPFAKAVLAAAPSATGPAIQIYESTQLIGRAYLLAGVYATAVILILLLFDFRNLGDALSAMAPVVIASALLVAIMRLADISLNFANMIVLPLIVGLGVSAGVHATHRWRQQPLDKPAGLAGGSGRAVTLTIFTTVIGFACMMIAEHRGIRSLGLVMSLGLTLVWVATIFFLPAILRLRTRETMSLEEHA